MGGGQLAVSYGKVKVKRNNPRMDQIPEDCGYMQQFEYNVDMNSNGVMSECIDWCQVNCEGKWGWWFEQSDLYDESFVSKRGLTFSVDANGNLNVTI